MNDTSVNITVYRWGGKWGPFEVKIPCGECTLTKDIINDVLKNELNHVKTNVQTHDWLSNWWKPLIKGGWHAPIVMVDGKIISQGKALNKGLLIEAVINAHTKQTPIQGNHVFGKASCPYCIEAKNLLNTVKVDHAYHDVIASPESLYEMLARVKPLIGAKTPVTVPQIWLGGNYVGGMKELKEKLKAVGEI